jgi:hypothetical protein
MDRSITRDARSMVPVDALLDEQEVALLAQVEELREEAARVAVAPAAAEQSLEHVSITRATLAAVLFGRGQGPDGWRKPASSMPERTGGGHVAGGRSWHQTW